MSHKQHPIPNTISRVRLDDDTDDDGDRFVCLTPDRFNAEVAKYFLRAVQQEFGEKLVIVLDNASYFIPKTLKKQAAADGLLLEFLPPRSQK